MKSISDSVDFGLNVPREEYAEDNSRCGYKLHDDDVELGGKLRTIAREEDLMSRRKPRKMALLCFPVSNPHYKKHEERKLSKRRMPTRIPFIERDS